MHIGQFVEMVQVEAGDEDVPQLEVKRAAEAPIQEMTGAPPTISPSRRTEAE